MILPNTYLHTIIYQLKNISLLTKYKEPMEVEVPRMSNEGLPHPMSSAMAKKGSTTTG